MITLNGKWEISPIDLTLPDDEVHVWCAFLDHPVAQLQHLEQTLSEEEHVRAERFHFERDRKDFIVARATLRNILSRYLNKEPRQLRFTYNKYGKPTLERERNSNSLCFNMSHSYGITLYAVSQGREIGVDVEHIRPDFATEEIAERFFSPKEVEALSAVPEHQKKEAFFCCWTRKEAFIKAIGQGVTFGLDYFDVSLAPGEPAALLSIKGKTEEARKWCLKELEVNSEYKAALAVEGHGWQLKNLQWQPFEQVGAKELIAL